MKTINEFLCKENNSNVFCDDRPDIFYLYYRHPFSYYYVNNFLLVKLMIFFS